jgi:hypothetical protein
MNFEKMLALAAIASGLIITPPTSAGMIVIDNLSIANSSTPKNSSDLAVSTIDASQPLSPRILSNNTLNQKLGAISFGKLVVNNSSATHKAITVSWLLDKGLFTGESNIALNFDVFTSNKLSNIDVLFNNKNLISVNITENVKNQPIKFALTPSQLLAVNNGGNLSLRINAAQNLDLAFDTTQTADNHPTSVPEPALVGLIGLGLTGLGFLRKKDNN